jgi:hypothetical protein
MTAHLISRRSFLITSSALLAAPLAKAEPATTQLTAAPVVERIRNHVGVPWRTETVDRILAGDPDTVVRGIAVTMMATLDVIERAVAAGKNMIITHEPTFYLHQDTTKEIQDDPTLKHKLDFIHKNNVDRTMRVIGKPTMPVKKVAASWGAASQNRAA